MKKTKKKKVVKLLSWERIKSLKIKDLKKLFVVASQGRLHYVAIVLFCGLVGAGGLRLTLSSFAATPTGTLDIVTYVGSATAGNEIGSVSVATNQGGSGVQCTPSSGTTDAGAGANHGHVHLTCPAASGGGPRTYVFSSASRDGYSLSGASPHAPGSVFHVSGGQTTTLSIVMNDDTPPPAATPASDASTPAPAGAPDGTLDIVTYDGSATAGNEIGSVDIVTAAGGSGVQCSPATGTTQAGAGDNHGHVHLTCPAAADGGPREYRFVSASRLNYVLNSVPHAANSTFHVSGGATTTLSLVMDRVSSLPPPTPTSSSSPTSAPTGTLDIVTYDGSATSGNEIGGVEVVTDQGGSGVQCTPASGTTDAGTSANHGHVHLTCPAAADGGPREYRFVSASRFNFVLNPTPHAAGSTFHVSSGATTTLSLVMDRVSSLPPPVTTSTPTPTPAPGPTTAPPPANQKTGSAQVTTYIYHTDGSKTRLGGVNLHIQSINYDTTDSAHSCNNYNETSESSGTPSNNSQYGQVHFNSCWVGATGNGKAYQLSYTQLPAGYSFRSFHITGPAGATFTSGATSNTDGLGEQFKINPNDTTKLEVWLNQNNESQVDLSNVKQVVTQSGTRYVPGDDSEASKQAAAALNLLTAGGTTDLSDIDPDEGDDFIDEDEDEDLNPPSPPGELSAIQDASGSVSLIWLASTGDPVDENVSYSVQRTVKNSTDDPEDIGDITTDLSVLDTSDNLEYPQTYVYIVTASDDNDNTSDESTVEITTTPLASNVAPSSVDPSADPDSADSDAGDSTNATSASDATDSTDATPADTPVNTTTINSPDQQAALVIPAGATAQALSCSVSASDSTGADLLTDIGTVVGDTAQPVCRDDSGDVVDEFADDVDMTLEEDDSDITDDTDLFGFDGTDWEQIPTTEDGAKSDTNKTETTSSKGNLKFTSAKKVKNGHKTKYVVKSKRILKLALVDRRGSTPNPTTPLVSLMLLVVVGVAARIIVRRRLAENYNSPYGSDLDLMAYNPENRPEPNDQVVTGQQPTYGDPTAEPRVTPIDQPRFVVHPDKPKDKR